MPRLQNVMFKNLNLLDFIQIKINKKIAVLLIELYSKSIKQIFDNN